MFPPSTYMGRLNEKLLPSFNGHETSYVSFKENFIKLTATYDESYLQMLLSSEQVMKDKELRLQLQQISTHAAQWIYLDYLFKSKIRQLLSIFNKWSGKEKMSSNGQIIAAMAEFTGAINQLKQLTKGDNKIATVLLLDLFSKKLPKDVCD